MRKIGIAALVIYLVIVIFNAVPVAIERIGSFASTRLGGIDEARLSLTSEQYVAEIARLKTIAFNAINSDRLKHGVPPVKFGSNLAAQDHAENMLVNGFLGHWWTDGRKPYMVYTQLGGTSYARENAAIVGFTPDEYVQLDCARILISCEKVEPEEDILDLQNAMMYDDAESDWGHRDNILDPGHRKVSIGIAFDRDLLTFVQHFEGGDFEAVVGPHLTDGVLTLTARVLEENVKLFEAAVVFREPLPVARSPGAISVLHSYCVGGGFSEDCGDPVSIILPPLPFGMEYLDINPIAVMATQWNLTSGSFILQADLGDAGLHPGVYTLVMFADNGLAEPDQTILELSMVIKD